MRIRNLLIIFTSIFHVLVSHAANDMGFSASVRVPCQEGCTADPSTLILFDFISFFSGMQKVYPCTPNGSSVFITNGITDYDIAKQYYQNIPEGVISNNPAQNATSPQSFTYNSRNVSTKSFKNSILEPGRHFDSLSWPVSLSLGNSYDFSLYTAISNGTNNSVTCSYFVSAIKLNVYFSGIKHATAEQLANLNWLQITNYDKNSNFLSGTIRVPAVFSQPLPNTIYYLNTEIDYIKTLFYCAQSSNASSPSCNLKPDSNESKFYTSFGEGNRYNATFTKLTSTIANLQNNYTTISKTETDKYGIEASFTIYMDTDQNNVVVPVPAVEAWDYYVTKEQSNQQ